MNTPTIDGMISGIPASLGSYAPVIEEIEATLRSPQCSLTTVAETIEKDPDLTARLLRLANSAFYGFATRLATVNEAISLIGIQQVQDLIVASSVVDRFVGVSPDFVDMESFWRHSLACGIGARALAMARRIPKSDKFFVAGLLHDVGRLVLYSQAPKIAGDVFRVYKNEPMLLREAEVKVLGYDHGQVGEALLIHWHYPNNLVQAVAYHHHPASGGVSQTEASIVHLSDHLVNAMQIGSSGERHVPPLQMKAWELLNFTPDVLASVVTAIDDQIEAVQEAFMCLKH
jgi:HD-like signal output (HDOD) protein